MYTIYWRWIFENCPFISHKKKKKLLMASQHLYDALQHFQWYGCRCGYVDLCIAYKLNENENWNAIYIENGWIII